MIETKWSSAWSQGIGHHFYKPR